jgi:predicted Zn finger-like uncharacterized protein
MLVQCPKCKTTYKVADDAIAKGASPSFRCSRCKHTFELAPEMDVPQGTADNAPESLRANPELPFTVTAPEPSEPAPARSESQPIADPPRDIVSPGAPATHEPDSSAGEPTLSAPPAASAPVENSATASPTTEKEEIEHSFPTREPVEKDVVVDIERNQAASVKPFLTLFILLVLAFAFVVAYQRIHPAATAEWMRSLPIVGRMVAHNDHVKSGVLLKSLETKYQSLQGSREVVVLTGIAVNQNPVMIRNVQLAGRLFDKEGKEIERQTMWIGNAISPQIIRGMTAQDVSDLQRLKPLKTFEIPSGDSVPFAIVFLRAGKPVQDARCEVLSAEADA